MSDGNLIDMKPAYSGNKKLRIECLERIADEALVYARLEQTADKIWESPGTRKAMRVF